MSPPLSTPRADDNRRWNLTGVGRWRVILLFVVVFLLVVILAGLYLRQIQPASGDTTEIRSSDGAVPALKLYLPEPGMYRLTEDDLRKAGWSAALEEPGLDDPDWVPLTSQGLAQNYWIEERDGSKAFVFYAQPAADLYNTEAVYILGDSSFSESQLEPSEPAAGPDKSPPPQLGDQSAIGSYGVQRYEGNELYLPQAEAEERWFWIALPAPMTHTIDIPALDLPLAIEGGETQAYLAVNLYSSTEATQSPDHHLRVLVNGQQVADETWDGKGHHLVEIWFDAGLLLEGENQITLVMPGDTGVAADLNHLDWLELGYPGLLQAQDDQLEFWSLGGVRSLSGFSGPVEVYDITDPGDVRLIEGHDLVADTLNLETISDHQYLVVGPQGYKSPSRISPLESQPNLRASGIGADYIAVGPEDLLAPIQPLLEYRAGQGLEVAGVPVEAVYDQFNHGIVSPQAIQRFMEYAAKNWDPEPRYLLLVGDASYDPKGYKAPLEANRLPAFLMDTVYGGQTASDVPYVQVNGDEWPDLALGLVPARTSEQVEIFVQKTLTYEANSESNGQDDGILAVADGLEASFQWDAKAFLDLFGDQVHSTLLAPQAGASDTAAQIQDNLESGVSLLAYFGHGSLNMWGKDRLFTVDDAADLGNTEKLPVVLNMTCLTGLYTHPEVESLAEAMLFNPNGGAAAVLAPSSLTLAYDQSFLSRPLVEEILKNPNATLGDVHLAARRRVSLDAPGTRDVMMTFMLFGDPALSLPFGGEDQ